ncbi:MAG: hypothetical protein A2V66_15190 [Ignavibacteria bacterium RBG_13_36_8]|nr:MAG: hypothetical protein A2V66_15190 [Ignavibacteria bacterium RBG_13_36_8]
MEIIDEFIVNFLKLADKYNKQAELKNSFSYYKVNYLASIRTPLGDSFSETDKILGYHCNLDIIFEPISEEAEVLNSSISFIFNEKKIMNIVYHENYNHLKRKDIDITKKNLDDFNKELELFCKKCIPVDENSS